MSLVCHIRPYPLENTGSRPLSQRQASEGLISSWVGDDQRIPAVVCLFFLLFVVIRIFLLRSARAAWSVTDICLHARIMVAVALNHIGISAYPDLGE
jgi:hypothetical protein